VCGDAALVVNATSISLDPSSASAAEALAAHFGRGQLVVDLVYRPSPTPFLEAAAAHGASVRNGLGMLVHQAAIQVQLHTGVEAPLDAMWAAVAAEGPLTAVIGK
jgi:shikimate dehydrogenase